MRAVGLTKEDILSRIIRSLATLALFAGVTLASASAASAATISVSPGNVAPGGALHLTGDVLAGGVPGCEVPSTVTLISQVFVGLGEFAGVPAVQVPVDAAGNYDTTVTINRAVFPGTYTITGRCGGGNLGVTATVVVDALPVTGAKAPVAPLVAIGSLLILLGGAFVLVPRRRVPAI